MSGLGSSFIPAIVNVEMIRNLNILLSNRLRMWFQENRATARTYGVVLSY